MPSLNTFLKTVGIIIAVFVGIWLLFQAMFGAAESATYVYVFRMLTTEGGINAWLARAVTVLFVAGVSYGCPLVFSFKKHRRLLGWGILAGTFVAFNLLMYACTRSVSAVQEGQHFVSATGGAKAWYYVTESGDWELFPHSGFHPRTGEPLKAMTPSAAKEYDAWKRATTIDGEKRSKAETESRFRETYLNESALASGAAAPRVVLAIKTDGAGLAGDSVAGSLAELLEKNNKRPVSGAFKPAFYSGGLFDGLWNGDQSVAERLRLFDANSPCFLLAKAAFSGAEKTRFEGLVSVQGTLSVVLLKHDGRTGPRTFKASGAGESPATAMEACAKRLIDAVDVGVLFPNQ